MRRVPALAIALFSYATAIAAVSVVAVASVVSLDDAAADRLVVVRAHEHRLTLTERLRWTSQHNTAAGRGYLISGLPLFRERLEETSARFVTLRRDLHRIEDDQRALELLAALDSAVAAYDRAQDEIIALKQRPHDTAKLEHRFESDLLPLRQTLARAIDAYVQRQDVARDEAYALFEKQRARATLLALGSIGLAAILAAVLVVLVSRRLARMYKRERSALAQAEAALAARDEILGIVAHDLRSPLSAITMRAGFMQKKADSEETRQQAESIETAGMRMESLIRRLLDVSTIEAGRFSVKREPCRLDEILHEGIELFDRAAANKSIRLETSVAEAGFIVHADKEQVIQVMSNLLGNAIKFTPQGGKIELSVDRDGTFVRFSVSDTGPGILPEHLPNVFDRFWKKDSPGGKGGRSWTKGTGLGLYIAKGIVEAHGGHLWAESEPGSGATFHFTLPILIRRTRRADEAEPESPRLH